VLRVPDVYTRIHAASLTDTGGATLVVLGLSLIAGLSLVTLKLVFAWIFIMLTTPAAANALANAAFSSGHKPRIGTFQIMRTDERRSTPRGGEKP
jgi:multicomponent Na+:H+ antiporter subunit G